MKKKRNIRILVFFLAFIMTFNLINEHKKAKAIFPLVPIVVGVGLSEGAKIGLTLLGMAGVKIIGDAMAYHIGKNIDDKLSSEGLYSIDTEGKTYLEVNETIIDKILNIIDVFKTDIPVSPMAVDYEITKTLLPNEQLIGYEKIIHSVKSTSALKTIQFTVNTASTLTLKAQIDNISSNRIGSSVTKSETLTAGALYQIRSYVYQTSVTYFQVEIYKLVNGTWAIQGIAQPQVATMGLPITDYKTYISTNLTLNPTVTETNTIPYSTGTTADYDREKLKIGLPPGTIIKPKISPTEVKFDGANTTEYVPDLVGEVVTPTDLPVETGWNSLWDWLRDILDAIRSIPQAIENILNPDMVGSDEATGEIITDKVDLSKFKQSWERLKNINTSRGLPPKVTIPLGQMFTTATSRFGSPGNPFHNEYILIDFEYLDNIKFGGIPVSDYFRNIIGFGFILMTLMSTWKKIVPNNALGGE